MKNDFDVKSLKQWFLQEKRDLPWRRSPSPYHVWVSEVMLQQTQVSVVIPYFKKWMEVFPTIEDLAQADEQKVLKVWEGLGYYSRARNLHKGAKYILENYGGKIPKSYDKLKKIKGLGPYTIGAILCFAFKQPVAAVDGNVIRVLSRYYVIDDDISKAKTVQKFRNLAEEIVPKKDPHIFNEALIELGAKVCKKNPNCFECPLKKGCKGFQCQITSNLPVNSRKVFISSLHRVVSVFHYKDKILLKKNTGKTIMSGLYEFPFIELEEGKKALSKEEFYRLLKIKWNFSFDNKKILKMVKHSYTRYRVFLYPFYFSLTSPFFIEGYEWKNLKEIKELPFSSGHKKVLLKAKEFLPL